jgi:hypothetical protein
MVLKSQILLLQLMERQVFWWEKNRFPEMPDFSQLSGLDGILIDFAGSNGETEAWQDRFARHAESMPFISFRDVLLLRRWLMMTMPDDYVSRALSWA